MKGSSGSTPNREEPSFGPFRFARPSLFVPTARCFLPRRSSPSCVLECILFTTHHSSCVRRSSLLALVAPKGASQVTSFRSVIISNAVSLITEGVGLPTTSGSFRPSLIEDTNIALLCHTGKGLSRSFCAADIFPLECPSPQKTV